MVYYERKISTKFDNLVHFRNSAFSGFFSLTVSPYYLLYSIFITSSFTLSRSVTLLLIFSPVRHSPFVLMFCFMFVLCSDGSVTTYTLVVLDSSSLELSESLYSEELESHEIDSLFSRSDKIVCICER